MTQPVGVLLKQWRERRRLSQLQLSIEADISTRHLSFVETGRAKPTSTMILRLSEQLDVPLRERNALLLAGGYAPAYPEGRLDGPQLAAVRASLRQVLAAHEPNPAVVVDRHWSMLDANAPIHALIAGVAPFLLTPPVNVLRLSLHPDGLAPRIANLGEWRDHLLSRLSRQAGGSGDPVLTALLEELHGYPAPAGPHTGGGPDVVVPLRLRVDGGEWRFYSITAVFGAPLDVTVSELAIESFLPADEATATALRAAAVPS